MVRVTGSRNYEKAEGSFLDPVTRRYEYNPSLKAVISFAGTQVRKYTNDLCEGFFCSRVFFRVFDLCDFVFFSPECADVPQLISIMR